MIENRKTLEEETRLRSIYRKIADALNELETENEIPAFNSELKGVTFTVEYEDGNWEVVFND